MQTITENPGRKAVAMIDEICAVAQKCVDAAKTVHDHQKLKRIEQIASWCAQTAERLAEDRFSSGEEPDYMADVASVAWELSQLSEGRWPAKHFKDRNGVVFNGRRRNIPP